MITKQALGSLLFGMADILRDKVEDYKSYILSLLYYKRLSDNYQWEIENGKEKFVSDYCREPSVREMDVISKKMHDFIIPEGCFWDDVRKASIDKKNERLAMLLHGASLLKHSGMVLTQLTKSNARWLPPTC